MWFSSTLSSFKERTRFFVKHFTLVGLMNLILVLLMVTRGQDRFGFIGTSPFLKQRRKKVLSVIEGCTLFASQPAWLPWVWPSVKLMEIEMDWLILELATNRYIAFFIDVLFVGLIILWNLWITMKFRLCNQNTLQITSYLPSECHCCLIED